MKLKIYLFALSVDSFSERLVNGGAACAKVKKVYAVFYCLSDDRLYLVRRGFLYAAHSEPESTYSLFTFGQFSVFYHLFLLENIRMLFIFAFKFFRHIDKQIAYMQMLRAGFFALAALYAVGSLAVIFGIYLAVIIVYIPVVINLLCVHA